MISDDTLIIEIGGDATLAMVALQGDLIAETRFELERIFRDWLDHGVRRILVDCSKLNYIDSAGLSTLLGGLHRARRNGGSLALAAMNESLHSLFEITSMHKYFEIFATIDEAASHLNAIASEKV